MVESRWCALGELGRCAALCGWRRGRRRCCCCCWACPCHGEEEEGPPSLRVDVDEMRRLGWEEGKARMDGSASSRTDDTFSIGGRTGAESCDQSCLSCHSFNSTLARRSCLPPFPTHHPPQAHREGQHRLSLLELLGRQPHAKRRSSSIHPPPQHQPPHRPASPPLLPRCASKCPPTRPHLSPHRDHHLARHARQGHPTNPTSSPLSSYDDARPKPSPLSLRLLPAPQPQPPPPPPQRNRLSHQTSPSSPPPSSRNAQNHKQSLLLKNTSSSHPRRAHAPVKS